MTLLCMCPNSLAPASMCVCLYVCHLARCHLTLCLTSLCVLEVSTSNRPPLDLYKNGLNSHQYIPSFVKTLESHCQIVTLDGGSDYRTIHSEKAAAVPAFRVQAASNTRSAACTAVLLRCMYCCTVVLHVLLHCCAACTAVLLYY